MIDEEMAKKLESDSAYKWEEQPLFVDKNQVSVILTPWIPINFLTLVR